MNVAAVGNIMNWGGLAAAVPLAILVMLLALFLVRRSKKRAKKQDSFWHYTVPDKSVAACLSLLGAPAAEDLFAYELQPGRDGGWYLHLTAHNPTGQPLDTLFLLTLQGEGPTLLRLRFVREAFGMREAVVGEALMGAFFTQKLGALRARPAQENENA